MVCNYLSIPKLQRFNIKSTAYCNCPIYIIITKNIRYLLWNQGLWRSLNNTYPIFLTPCIRCTNHLCDSCDLTDVNRHFYPVTAPNGSKCWPIVTSSIQEPVASNCDVTMTDCSRVVAMDAFLAQRWGQWFNDFVKDTSVPSFSTLWKKTVTRHEIMVLTKL